MWRREDDLRKMLRDSVEAFAASEHGLPRFRACRDSVCGFDPDVWSAMADLGWTGMLLDEADGGSGLEFAAALTVAEVFGRRLIPEPFVAAAVMAATVLGASPAPRARRIATDLSAGRAVVTLAFQEALDQIVGGRPRTTLTRTAAGLRLDGAKIFVPAWTPRTLSLVTAEHDGRIAVVAVAPDAAGLDVAPRRMADGGVTADLIFDGVAIDDDAVLGTGPDAAGAVEEAIARGQLAISAMLEGLAATLIRMTIDHVNRRSQFGRPLAHLQSLRHTLVDLHMGIELTGAAWRTAAEDLAAAGPVAARGSVSAAKARASDTARAVADAAVQFHGAFGYTEEADVGLFVNASLRWASWLGSAPAHRAASLATEASREGTHV